MGWRDLSAHVGEMSSTVARSCHGKHPGEDPPTTWNLPGTRYNAYLAMHHGQSDSIAQGNTVDGLP